LGFEDMVTTSGPGLTLPLSPAYSIVLVHSGFACGGGIDHGDSRRSGFYRWVRAAFGDFWGFQGGWWNWRRFVPFGRHVRRFDGGLSDVFLPWASSAGSTTRLPSS